nr:MAG TPA: Membrane fusion protein p14 fusion protein transmembrane domain [Caudoviricetes sp.]
MSNYSWFDLLTLIIFGIFGLFVYLFKRYQISVNY